MRIAISFFIAFLFLSTHMNAQFTKGTRMVGASLGSAFFNSGKSEYTVPSPTSGYTSNSNSLGISVSPNIGWFLSSDLVVGTRILLGYDYEKNIDDDNNVTFRKNISKKFNLSVGGFARKYFSTGNFLPFAQLNIDAGTGVTNTEGFFYATNYKETYTGKSSGDFSADAGLSVGFTKMLNANTGLDFFAGYLFSYNKNKFKTTTSKDVDYNGTIDETGQRELTTKYTNHGVNIGVGFQIFLGKRK